MAPDSAAYSVIPAKRSDMEVQFISSNPVKKQKGLDGTVRGLMSNEDHQSIEASMVGFHPSRIPIGAILKPHLQAHRACSEPPSNRRANSLPDSSVSAEQMPLKATRPWKIQTQEVLLQKPLKTDNQTPDTKPIGQAVGRKLTDTDAPHDVTSSIGSDGFSKPAQGPSAPNINTCSTHRRVSPEPQVPITLENFTFVRALRRDPSRQVHTSPPVSPRQRVGQLLQPSLQPLPLICASLPTPQGRKVPVIQAVTVAPHSKTPKIETRHIVQPNSTASESFTVSQAYAQQATAASSVPAATQTQAIPWSATPDQGCLTASTTGRHVPLHQSPQPPVNVHSIASKEISCQAYTHPGQTMTRLPQISEMVPLTEAKCISPSYEKKVPLQHGFVSHAFLEEATRKEESVVGPAIRHPPPQEQHQVWERGPQQMQQQHQMLSESQYVVQGSQVRDKRSSTAHARVHAEQRTPAPSLEARAQAQAIRESRKLQQTQQQQQQQQQRQQQQQQQQQQHQSQLQVHPSTIADTSPPSQHFYHQTPPPCHQPSEQYRDQRKVQQQQQMPATEQPSQQPQQQHFASQQHPYHQIVQQPYLYQQQQKLQQQNRQQQALFPHHQYPQPYPHASHHQPQQQAPQQPQAAKMSNAAQGWAWQQSQAPPPPSGQQSTQQPIIDLRAAMGATSGLPLPPSSSAPGYSKAAIYGPVSVPPSTMMAGHPYYVRAAGGYGMTAAQHGHAVSVQWPHSTYVSGGMEAAMSVPPLLPQSPVIARGRRQRAKGGDGNGGGSGRRRSSSESSESSDNNGGGAGEASGSPTRAGQKTGRGGGGGRDGSSRKHAPNLVVDVAETAAATFPFAAVAQRHSLPVHKVRDVFQAVVQLPLLRCSTDKRRHGKLGTSRIKEYQKAKKEYLVARGINLKPPGPPPPGQERQPPPELNRNDMRELANRLGPIGDGRGTNGAEKLAGEEIVTEDLKRLRREGLL